MVSLRIKVETLWSEWEFSPDLSLKGRKGYFEGRWRGFESLIIGFIGLQKKTIFLCSYFRFDKEKG